MIRRSTRAAAAVGLALAVTGCGVHPESDPEPIPPTIPVVRPPSVTQEPAPRGPTPSPAPPPPGSAGS
ncbi:hypothetical protein C8D89_11277 [Actinomycetospora cinnamomea]|uniref:Uncharacterized protein n=1 Tax=Actinomycetospora cinnamomea TaxID=663609 RepID=A0A2U1F3Y1_9PSEU|nr:hypothetical protein C8D89_11277 [Actinomycetospora cinnamomea]